jgi:phosphatidylinositol-specific phospholipase C-like protein
MWRMAWAGVAVSAGVTSGASYAVSGGRLYCAFAGESGRVVLAVMAPDRSWSRLPQVGPSVGGVAPTVLGLGAGLLTVCVAPGPSGALSFATFAPSADPPSWSQPRTIPALRTRHSVGLVVHRGRVWCAVADEVAGRVSLLSRVSGPWQVEAPVEVVASGSPALVVVDGYLHCMVPAGRAHGGTVVDWVYSDEHTSWARAPQQPGVTTTSGVSACVVNGVRYLAYGNSSGTVSVTRQVDGGWQEPETVLDAPSPTRPALAQFANQLLVAGHDVGAATVRGAARVAVPLQSWMAQVPDGRTLGELSIPGTHDSCALYGGFVACTQTMSLTEQFSAGVRWFDIRLVWDGSTLKAHHGIVDERVTFTDVLQSLLGCLDQQASEGRPSSEAVFVSIKDEGSDADPAAFAQAVNAVLTRCSDRLHWVGLAQNQRQPMPTLGELRGKVVVLARSDLGPGVGLRLAPWPASNATVVSFTPHDADFPVAVEDDWNIENPFDLAAKWTAVESSLKGVAGAQDSWHLTFTSASSSLLTNWPAMAAEGPWTHHSIGINSRLARLLETWPADASLGTVVMDFPGYPEMRICPAIIARNLPT